MYFWWNSKKCFVSKCQKEHEKLIINDVFDKLKEFAKAYLHYVAVLENISFMKLLFIRKV